MSIDRNVRFLRIPGRCNEHAESALPGEREVRQKSLEFLDWVL